MTARQTVLLFLRITGSKREPSRPRRRWGSRPAGLARVIPFLTRQATGHTASVPRAGDERPPQGTELRPGDQAAALLFLMEWDRRRWQAERQRVRLEPKAEVAR